MGMELKKRSELKVEDTWNMADMLPSDDAWEELYRKTREEIAKYATFEGRLAQSGRTLYDALEFDSECSLHIETLYVYGKQRSDEDTANQKYQDFAERAQVLGYQAAEASAYMTPEILKIPDETMTSFLETCGELKKFKRTLELILRKKAHTLTTEMEALLAQSFEATQNSSQIFSMFNNADIQFPVIKGEDGQEISITHGNFISLLQSRDREVRKQAFQGLYDAYKQFKNTVASVFGANLKQASFYAKVRNYSSSMEYYLDENEIPVTVYDNLLSAIHEYLPVMHRYVGLRKKLMGLDELHMYDIYVPVVENVTRKYSFEKAKEMVKEGLAPLGDEYLKLLQEGFDNRWIDVYENVGKRSGAYSWGVYGSHPYVLLNYDGILDHVFTLAHEMGHALQTYYSDHSQTYADAGYKIFVAEVASTCNEALLIRHMLNQTEDRRERAYLLNHFLESFRSTVFRQAMFAEFEKITHEKVAAGETMTAGTLCEIYQRLNQQYYGPEVVIDEEISYEWERIPHFYTPFYVYQYATGFSAAIAISSRILKGEEGALDGYYQFLKGGNSMPPIELLKLCGIDMATPHPVREALDFFKELLDEFETLAS